MNSVAEIKPVILDLGCGKKKVQGAIGIDKVKLEGVDLVHDLASFPYPFDSNSVDKIYCRHVLEHFDTETRNRIIDEIYRILKKWHPLAAAQSFQF